MDSDDRSVMSVASDFGRTAQQLVNNLLSIKNRPKTTESSSGTELLDNPAQTISLRQIDIYKQKNQKLPNYDLIGSVISMFIGEQSPEDSFF